MSKTIAFLLNNHFEKAEYAEVNRLLEDKGYSTVLITTNDDKQVRSMNKDVDKAEAFTADLFLTEADANDYDAVVLPGGTVNADNLRVDSEAQAFVKSLYDNDKLVAAICHAPWLLINTGIVKGKTLTAYHSLQQDIENAGGKFVDKEMQQDGNVITSRSPKDIGAFVAAIDAALTKI